MSADAIRSRLRVIRSLFLWVVLAALAATALVFGHLVISGVLAIAVVVLVIFRLFREASIRHTIERADTTRIDQSSPATAAGFTSIGTFGVVVQVVIMLAIDALLFASVRAHRAGALTIELTVIAALLTICVIVIAALTVRLRHRQRAGMAALERRA